jgi:hypothetical protein
MQPSSAGLASRNDSFLRLFFSWAALTPETAAKAAKEQATATNFIVGVWIVVLICLIVSLLE